ncbi:hypothetical protein F5Y00DRAFT_272441 [Daldinia vernicosa]|uniref:uncharacterized protein n=1 Tax=Daldinia vernicosa TaxID=114800 RepID=UPI0020077B7A|nr:uncharacterized protein F5Y00DRAFT_272441 [Daldinia vernicosa]KAI0852816.1 hypothetical protein F5Y00DRAFT_272441 [Daldinia vernicosa]
MASYTVPQESEPHPPGSFPTDDTVGTQDSSLTSSGSRHQHNKLHKREDPRGWSEEEKATWGHQHTDSGIGLTDPSLSSNPNIRGQVDEGTFQSNNATTTTRSPNYQGNEGKPGVMTGAYGHNNVNSGGNYYPKSTAEDTSSQNQTSARGIGAVGPATGLATATGQNTESRQMPEDRNTIRNGLRQTSNVEHEDPYWGDVPHGTGIYNTVTGHGSSETATEGSLHSHDPLSHEQQRAFPLATSNNAPHDETGHRTDSRFKENLGESTTGAAAGLTTYELAERRRDHQHEDDLKEPTARKHHGADTKKESKIGGLFHRDHKDEKETKSEKLKEPVPSKDDRSLRERDAGVALAAATGAYGAKNHADKHDKKTRESEHDVADEKANALYQHPNEKIDSKDPFIAAGYKEPGSQGSTKITNNAYPPSEDVTTRDHPFTTSQTTEKLNERNDSKLGYGLAAAGVGAGAGYAAQEHSHRDSDKNKVHPNQQAFHDSTTASKATTQPSDAGYTIGKPQLAVFSGTGEATAPHDKTQGLPQTSSGANRSIDDPSHHGEYNVLQDGTPSGVNIGDHHYGDKKNVAFSSQDATRGAVTKDNHTGAKAAVAGAGVAGAGTAAHYTGERNSNTSSAPYEVSGANGRAPTHLIHDSTYKTLPTGTPSGINVDDGQQYDKHNVATSSPTSATRGAVDDNNHSRAKAAAAGAAGVVGAGAAAKHHSQRDTNNTTAVPSTTTSHDRQSPTTRSNRASSHSSHGGQYNVLPSGTPSGINIGERDGLGRKSLDNTTSKAKTPATASHPTATSAVPASKKDATTSTSAAVIPARLNPADKVLHRCRKCGEENDITGYFRV